VQQLFQQQPSPPCECPKQEEVPQTYLQVDISKSQRDRLSGSTAVPSSWTDSVVSGSPEPDNWEEELLDGLDALTSSKTQPPRRLRFAATASSSSSAFPENDQVSTLPPLGHGLAVRRLEGLGTQWDISDVRGEVSLSL